MNTKELCKFISSQYPEYHDYEIEDFIKMFVDCTTQVLQSGERIMIKNFGSFTPKYTQMVVSPNLKNVEGSCGGNLTVRYKPSTVFLANLRNENEIDLTLSEDV